MARKAGGGMEFAGVKKVKKVVAKTKMLKNLKKAMKDDEDSDDDPVTDVMQSDMSIVTKSMSIGCVHIDAWLAQLSLPDVNDLIAINGDEAKHVSARMEGYSEYIPELRRLKEFYPPSFVRD